jgi:hypothetical protein
MPESIHHLFIEDARGRALVGVTMDTALGIIVVTDLRGAPWWTHTESYAPGSAIANFLIGEWIWNKRAVLDYVYGLRHFGMMRPARMVAYKQTPAGVAGTDVQTF